MQIRWLRLLSALILLPAAVVLSRPSCAEFIQQGGKLTGTGGTGNPVQGAAVALSADGNTLVVGGPGDNGGYYGIGAFWTFTRSNGVWTQQGGKVVGTTAVINQGASIGLSADGNTLVEGGGFCCQTGALAFVRTNGVWSQQGGVLTGNDRAGYFDTTGQSVALSSDGNTAVISNQWDNPLDDYTNGAPGAVWVFTRSGGTWTQLGKKIVGSGVVQNSGFGNRVALSGDGKTFIVAGDLANSVPAIWVYTNNGGTWTQQGNPIVAPSGGTLTGEMGLSGDGNTFAVGGWIGNGPAGVLVYARSNGAWSLTGNLTTTDPTVDIPHQNVAVSTDGNTVIVAGYKNVYTCAAVAFGRSGNTWTQIGTPLVGANQVGDCTEGPVSVALSSNGGTAAVGGAYDNSDNGGPGAVWAFVQGGKTATHDFNGDGFSDILWNAQSGATAIWLMNGSQVLSSGSIGNVPAWAIWGQRDFNGDGKSDILWQDVSGDTAIWFMNGFQVAASAFIGNVPSATWMIAGTGDFNGDGKGDILWRDTSGNVAIWFMNGAQVASSAFLGNVPTNWLIYGTGDFDGNGTSDILWRDNNGNTAIWFMNGAQATSASVGAVPCCWTIVGTGDFNGDGKSDILWRNSVGDLAIWLMNGSQVASSGSLGNVPTNWSVAQTGDYNGDGMSDILWRDTNAGTVAVWLMNGLTVAGSAAVGSVPTSWTIQGTNAD